MKPYITDIQIVNGKNFLPFQVEGISKAELEPLLTQTTITAYAIPQNQSLQSTWRLRLYLEAGFILELNSACTRIREMQEIASLNMNLFPLNTKLNSWGFVIIKLFNKFNITSINKIVYEDDQDISESGIVFRNSEGDAVYIIPGIAPGSVSVGAPFSTLPIDGEMELEDYREVPFS